jgi:uncharacterized protein
MIQPVAGGVVIQVRVVTRASRPGIAGARDGELVVRLQSAPIDNAANEELIERLADILRVSKRSVTIVYGERSRSKRVRAIGVDLPTARSRLGLTGPA